MKLLEYIKTLLEDIQLKIGCYWLFLCVATFLLFIVLFPTFGIDAFWILILMALLIFFGFIYYQHYAKERLSAYTKMLTTTGKKKFDIPQSEAHVLFKKVKACNKFLLTAKEYRISIIYFTDDFCVVTNKCPIFNIFKLQREDMKKRWVIKTGCGANKEFYYSYIQSVHFNSEKKTLDIVLTSGDIEHIQSDKKYAEKAVMLLRKKLRRTDRGVQTNPIKS